MLALARGEGQSIIIDGQIEVKVVKWSRSSVRLAIQAPRSVTVDRDEIWRKMNPGQMTPLEVAEKERNERFAREAAGGAAAQHVAHGEVVVAAPTAGVFTAMGPEGEARVVVGRAVAAGRVVGTIAGVDGVVTEVRAGVKGQVVRMLAENGKTVAAGEAVVGVRLG
jgi:carbon storage regulator